MTLATPHRRDEPRARSCRSARRTRSTSSRARRFVADFIGNVNMFEGTRRRGRAGPRAHRLAGAGRADLRRPRRQRAARRDASGRRCGPEKIIHRPRDAAGAEHRQLRRRAWSRTSPTSATCRSTWCSSTAARCVRVTQPNTHRASPTSASPGTSGSGSELGRVAAPVVLTRMSAAHSAAAARRTARRSTGWSTGPRRSSIARARTLLAAAVLPRAVPHRPEDQLRRHATRACRRTRRCSSGRQGRARPAQAATSTTTLFLFAGPPVLRGLPRTR